MRYPDFIFRIFHLSAVPVNFSLRLSLRHRFLSPGLAARLPANSHEIDRTHIEAIWVVVNFVEKAVFSSNFAQKSALYYKNSHTPSAKPTLVVSMLISPGIFIEIVVQEDRDSWQDHYVSD